MRIAFFGGGSVQWTPGLVTDIALTGADLVLHDIDADALELLALACKRIVDQVDGTMNISATTDPLLRDPETAVSMLDELLAANKKFMTPEYLGYNVTFKPIR